MTTLQLKVSPRALSALAIYVEQTGLGTDAAADELILMAAASKGVQPDQIYDVATSMSDKKRAFLAHLKEWGTVSAACDIAGISQGLPYGWSRTDVEFAKAFEDVKAELRDERRRQGHNI